MLLCFVSAVLALCLHLHYILRLILHNDCKFTMLLLYFFISIVLNVPLQRSVYILYIYLFIYRTDIEGTFVKLLCIYIYYRTGTECAFQTSY